MPDKRAISFWVALQDVDVDNGCMWFVPGSHKLPIRKHYKVKAGHHVTTCDCSEVCHFLIFKPSICLLENAQQLDILFSKPQSIYFQGQPFLGSVPFNRIKVKDNLSSL